MTVTCPRCASRTQTALNAGAPRVCPVCGASLSPPPLALSTVGARGGSVDLPTPKRAASGYIGQLTAPQAAGGFMDAEFDPKLDTELPSVFNDLELGEFLEPASPVPPSRPIFLGLDLRDLPSPVGPKPRSPLSLRGAFSSALPEPRPAASLPAEPPMAAAAAAPGPFESEPAPLPAPPTRSPLAELVEAMAAPALAAVGDGKAAGRPEAALPAGKRVSNSGLVVPALMAPPPIKRVSNPAMGVPNFAAPAAGKRASSPALVVPELGIPPAAKRVSNPASATEAGAPTAGMRVSNPAPVVPELGAPPAGKRVSNPAIAIEAGAPAAGKRVSNPALVVPELGPPPAGNRVSSPGLVVPNLAAPPAGKRISSPGLVVAPPAEAARATQPLPRRSSQPGLPLFNKPIHALFDASDTPLPPAIRAADSTPPALALPSLPSDDSGSAQASAPGDSSGGSVRSGAPAGNSAITVEPRPVRLGYVIAGLAVLAILLAVIIAHIAGTWNKHPASGNHALPAAPAASAPASDAPPN